jgi:serine phosphatase RsbU (regulator of sigma subunit)
MISKSKRTLQLILAGICVLLSGKGYSQLNADSLQRLVASAKEDTMKVYWMSQIAFGYIGTKELDKAEIKMKDLQLLSERIGYGKGLAAAWRGFAAICKSRHQLDQSIEYFKKAASAYQAMKDQGGLAEMYGSIGNIYYEKGAYAQSTEYFLKALNIYEKQGDKRKIAGYSGNLGAIYESMGQPEKSIDFYNKALKINTELGDKQGIAINYVCLGNSYMDFKDSARALMYHFKALKLNEELGDSVYLSNNLSNIAATYERSKDYPKAIVFFQKAIEATASDDMQQKVTNLQNMGELYIKLKQYRKAEACLLKNEKLLEVYNAMNVKDKNAEFLSALYDSLGDHKRSLHYYRQHIQWRDSIYNNENNKKITESHLQFEYAKKAAADSIRVAEDKKVVAARLKQEKTQRFALYGGLALTALFAGFMFNRFRITNRQKKIIELQEKETQQQKQIIEQKHKEITDSINYAERIQRSFLATKELLDRNLQEYFVLFKPKDVVSGDFYWAGNLKNGHFALVTADSTGHGVPGAIMSLLNITSIETSIREGLTAPSDILNETRKTIIERLKNDGSEEGGKDGMDGSLCVFDFPNRKLYIAAAYNPVWIVRSNKVTEVKPDNMPVGKHDKQDIPFTEHTFDLQKGDVVYTLTDGFPDQFGGPGGKKFMTKKLRELLAANAHLPLEQQKQLLEETFGDWMGTMEQVDDVCILGIRLG